MKTITLDDVTQEEFDAAAQVVIAGIKAFNRKLDTRSGTVLRDLLVDPSAAIESVATGQIAEVRKSTSLMRMKEAQDAGEEIDQDDVNAILSNFNITPASGKTARGLVKIVVSDETVAYSVPEGALFTTVDGIRFSADSQIIAASFELSNSSIVATTKLYEGAAGYFFLVPVTAVETGSSGNIQQGTSLQPESAVSNFVMAEAYKDFDGGSDVQSMDSVIKSIPSGLSIRGFVNKAAVEGMLRAEFDGGNNPIVAVSAVGYGNPAQRRDKHNLFGVGVGGRVDVYVRNFSDLATDTKLISGTWVSKDGFTGYEIKVPAGKFPSACWIKSVADPYESSVSSSSSDSSESDARKEQVLESLDFDAYRTADVSDTWHDIDADDASVEAFNTVWQGFVIRLHEVEHTTDDREFNVTAYILPQANAIQEYVDRDDVRNVATDVVVRCPIICNVSVNAVVQYDPNNPIDDSLAKSRIRDYINNLGFVGRLSRSEIVQILKNLGAVYVDMPNQDMLYGTLHDAKGIRHALSGDALDVSSISDASAMLTRDTVIFAAEDRNIQIRLIPNK